MVTLIRQRTLTIGPLTLTIKMPDAAAERITRSLLYRSVLRPAAMRVRRLLRGLRNPKLSGNWRTAIHSLPATPPLPDDIDRADLELRQKAARLVWEQVVELTHEVVTPGVMDYRAVRAISKLPDSLSGMRCLDAARRDGFWAFELEARGADEVLALDWAPYVDMPALARDGGQVSDARAYTFAREVKESTVRSVACHPYDLDPSKLGKFDLVIVADVLTRLRNPELALERLLSVCRGTLILAEPFDPRFDRYGNIGLLEYHVEAGREPRRWWTPGVVYLKRTLETAGFQRVGELGRWQAESGTGEPIRMVVLCASTAEPSAAATKAAVGRHGINLMGQRPKPPKTVDLSMTAEVGLNFGRADSQLPSVRGMRTSQDNQSTAETPEPLVNKVAEIDWYHTIDLGHGLVTPGFVDHRYQLPLYHLPDSLEGSRCLDVATFDGFWSFELERRGAAEVVAADIKNRTDGDIPGPVKEAVARHLDAPMGAGFQVAREALGSSVVHKVCNVYDLTPERVGTFDFVFLSDLLLHIRDPQLALERVFSVCRGDLLVADVYLPGLDHYGERCLTACPGWMPGSYVWWLPGIQTLKRMLSVAGFVDITEVDRFRLETLGGDAAKVVLVAKVPAWKTAQATQAASIDLSVTPRNTRSIESATSR